jgi:anti-sigma regulatory factor (Ser/Thr protein kinase)
MTETRDRKPATLRVYRYRSSDDSLRLILGDQEAPISRDRLIKHARRAMERASFVCFAAPSPARTSADEICFVPTDDGCDILTIHANGWRRHHGDHRRSLVEILTDLAAAVARGRLNVLDDDQLVVERGRGRPLLTCSVIDSASLAAARGAAELFMKDAGLSPEDRQKTVLCFSEAVTNMLVHGGGGGNVQLRRLDDSLRFVVTDKGPGLGFLNWIEPPAESGQASMGYGYKIMLENMESVSLHTGSAGTTLILDRKV